MKQDTTNRSWVPTLTLAKLFEEQNQFYDALSAYELISQNDSSPAIRQKIESLQMRILSEPGMKYDARIEKLFSPEELAYLKILNHAGFENLSRVQEQINQGVSEYEVVFEDDGTEENVLDPAEELQKMLEEIDTQAQKASADPKPELVEPTVGELAVELIRRYGKDSKISSLSIKEFLQLILDYNLPGKIDKS